MHSVCLMKKLGDLQSLYGDTQNLNETAFIWYEYIMRMKDEEDDQNGSKLRITMRKRGKPGLPWIKGITDSITTERYKRMAIEL